MDSNRGLKNGNLCLYRIFEIGVNIRITLKIQLETKSNLQRWQASLQRAGLEMSLLF
jgi:hypothetical protein